MGNPSHPDAGSSRLPKATSYGKVNQPGRTQYRTNPCQNDGTALWNNQRPGNIIAPTWNIHRPTNEVVDKTQVLHDPAVFPPTAHVDPSVGVTIVIPLASHREKEQMINNYEKFVAGSIKRGRLDLTDGLFDVEDAVYGIFPSDKGSKALGVKEFCCKRPGPFLNDLARIRRGCCARRCGACTERYHISPHHPSCLRRAG